LSEQPPLVLLHGLGTGPGAWLPQIEVLSAEREVLAPDLVAAYGRGWDAAVEEVGELVASRGPVDICGLSLGALVALRIAADDPWKVGSLSVCAGFDRLPPRVRRRIRRIAWLMGMVPRGFLHRQLVAGIPEPYRRQALTEIRPLRPRQVARLMREAAGFELDPVRIEAPTLVLCGERDRANLPLARALADALPSGELALVPAAGHVANLDNPEAFTALLVDGPSRL
jgi:3-oxoadipate enol-lactonase